MAINDDVVPRVRGILLTPNDDNGALNGRVIANVLLPPRAPLVNGRLRLVGLQRSAVDKNNLPLRRPLFANKNLNFSLEAFLNFWEA